MSADVLRNLQEFRREKAKQREKQENEQTNQKAQQNEEVVRNETKTSVAGGEWDFLTRAEPVGEDYEDNGAGVSTRIAVVAYLIGQALAAWVQFGAVFFILSLIFFIYWNTGRRRRGEMSAYSVFNANCERLAGSMTAEHFERDMLRQRR